VPTHSKKYHRDRVRSDKPVAVPSPCPAPIFLPLPALSINNFVFFFFFFFFNFFLHLLRVLPARDQASAAVEWSPLTTSVVSSFFFASVPLREPSLRSVLKAVR